MAGAMTALAQFIVIAYRLLIDVPDRERCVDAIERLSHGATILGHPPALALVCRDAPSRFLPTRQPQAAAA